jgi:hypothetical protein
MILAGDTWCGSCGDDDVAVFARVHRAHAHRAVAGLVHCEQFGARGDDLGARSGSPARGRARTARVLASGSSSRRMQALATSRRLCGGMSVAMPTAMPVVPFSSTCGSRAGSSSAPPGCRRSSAPVDRALAELGQQHGGDTGSASTRCSASPRRLRIVRRTPVALARRSADSGTRTAAPSAPSPRTQALSPCGWNLPITSPTVRADFLCLAAAQARVRSWRR